tara:strand:+ start:141 stop:1118 length:978 start_codon:yes stop_codon:yes gene_type:complete
MKTFIPFTIAAALAASSLANAQAFSKPSGYVTQELAPNQFNLVGLTLQGSPLASGVIETVSGTLVTDSELVFTPVAGRAYVLEILTGTIAGTVQSVPAESIVGTTITTPDDLASMGLAAADTYALRLAPTLEEIFGTDASSVLTRALSSGNADIVWLPAGGGAYNKYYVNVIAGEFRSVDTNTATPNIPLIYTDGILVQKRSTASSLVITGSVKTTPSNTVLGQGFNLVSLVSPTGTTLFNSGIEDDLTAALSEGNADILWVPTSGGGYDKYFRNPIGGGTWRNVAAAGTAITVDTPLPSAVFIQRKLASPTNLDLTVPTEYSNL